MKESKRMCLYSTDTALINIHMKNKFCKQTEAKSLLFVKRFWKGKWNFKLIRGKLIRGSRYGIMIPIGKKNWCQSRPHLSFIVTMVL